MDWAVLFKLELRSPSQKGFEILELDLVHHDAYGCQQSISSCGIPLRICNGCFEGELLDPKILHVRRDGLALVLQNVVLGFRANDTANLGP